ncbi:hypothetical protein ACFQFG_15820 [Methylobacterium persicinum]
MAPNVGAFSTALMSLRNFTIDTIGKGSGAIIIDKSSTQTTLDGMGFNGNPPGGYLVLAYGDTVKISNGSCYLGDPTAWCYGFDTWGHNHEITGNTLYGFGGYGNGGNGVRILQTQYGIPKVAISSITSAGGVATVTTSSPHGYTTGTYVAIRGRRRPPTTSPTRRRSPSPGRRPSPIPSRVRRPRPPRWRADRRSTPPATSTARLTGSRAR